MVALSHLKSLQALDAAVRAGSLKGAADVLAITPAAVGQRIKALEDHLGVDLLARGRSGLSPTPALAATLGPLSSAFSDLEKVAATLDLHRGHDIHVAAASDFAELWLQPRLARFRDALPNTRFCINGEGDAPLRVGMVDCEIFFGPDAENPNVDTLFRDVVVPISSPANTERIARLPERDRFEGFPLLHLDFFRDDPSTPNWGDWLRARRIPRSSPDRGIRFQRMAPVVEAVLADAGLAICGVALIAELIDDGRLSLPFARDAGVTTDFAFQARFRSHALTRPQVRRFRCWLQEEAERTRAWLGAFKGRSSPKPG